MNSKVVNKKIKHMFPEYQDLVTTLRHDDPHFARLFNDHHELDQHIACALLAKLIFPAGFPYPRDAIGNLSANRIRKRQPACM